VLVRLPVQRPRGCAGFSAAVLRGAVQATDPFIAVDHFRMAQPTFGAHPHAGFSAVTYLFPDSETALLSRDSLGGQHLIEPGSVHWTLAGRGVVHEEVPAEAGRTARGLQMFVNLPAAQKQRAPAVLHLTAAQMPHRHGSGWHEVQVFGGTAPLALPVFAALRMVNVQAGAAYGAELADGEHGFVWLISGQGLLGTHAVADGDAWVLGADDSARAVHATTALQLAVFSGRPLRETVVQHGPFVMNSEAEIVSAMQRFQAGDMGRLAPAPKAPAA
jgi:redox-sensitive bicupin YhaK (pirin superfamily)